ncbi:LuxR family two component transcriptional regulator [Chondrocystis sp. NIES-4102]|nr:LuxR family two component transcriptional regulator [Chondrocystis sp. NIES-4102]
MIRVLIVDDQKTVREALKITLESATDLEIVGTANDGLAAIEQVELLHPDIVVMNMEMPRLDGAGATKEITNHYSDTKVLILTSDDSDEYITKSLAMGAKGYLLKDTDIEDLVGAIRNVYKGYTQISPGLLEKLLIYTDSGVILNKIKNPITLAEDSKKIVPKSPQAIANLQIVYRQQQKELSQLRHISEDNQQELPIIKNNVANYRKYMWLTLLFLLLSMPIIGLALFQLYNKTTRIQSIAIPIERIGIRGEFSLNGIAERVAKAFKQDPILADITTVYVAQEDDAIILMGTLSEESLLRRMENIAKQVEGVKKVYSSQVAIEQELNNKYLGSNEYSYSR